MRSRRFAAVSFHITTGPLSIADPLAVDAQQRIARLLAQRRGEVSTAGTGSLEEETFESLPVALDPNENPLVRGTSVFGALRSHLSQYELTPGVVLTFTSNDSRGAGRRWTRPATLADLLCGSDPEERDQTGMNPALRPSAVRLVTVEATGKPCHDSRTRTAVARDRGAPVPTKLFGRGSVEGLVLDVILQVDLPILDQSMQTLGAAGTGLAAVEELVAAIRAWVPRLGGGIGVGLGGATAGSVRWGVADPLPVAELLSAETTLSVFRRLAASSVAPSGQVLCRKTTSEDEWRFDVALRCVDPLLVSPRVDGAKKNLARTAGAVHGSSWRGLFRSRSEFILRTCGIGVCRSSEEGTCGRCATCVLFGWAPRPQDAPDSMGAAGLIRFLDSPVSGTSMTYTHAPVDRFTGGAADMKLFERTSWAPGSTLTLAVEQASPVRGVPMWATHLLSLVVLDLHDGLIGVGASTTRGYGTVAVADPEALPAVPPDWLHEVPRESAHVEVGR